MQLLNLLFWTGYTYVLFNWLFLLSGNFISAIRTFHSDQYVNQESFEMVEKQRKVCPGCTTETTPSISLFSQTPVSLDGVPILNGSDFCFMVFGLWTNQRYLGMNAILLALKQCHQHVNNTTVMIAMDNSSVVAYLRKQGDTHSPSLCMEVWETLRWCDNGNINILVRHVPSKSNVLADWLSRLSMPISTEWCLDQTVCNLILSVTGYPNIDLFVTRLNNRLPVYVSPIPDDRALAIDALSMNCDRTGISSVRSDSGNN